MIVLLTLPLTYSYPELYSPTLVIANRDSPDEEYAKMIIDNLYLKRKIEVLNASEVEVFEREIECIPNTGQQHLSGLYGIYRENNITYVE
ncbi:MAG TPA: hypothetical protein EYP47_04815 [Methanococcaceae archaeon]|uniref:Uncharacterized protein n=1 Tax=Methanothermococcus okinawensis TaxID=155863 RepID=A0A832ZM34_9EURY|nr:hypothetical protein [Methanococcaceae archaeon]HIP91386.1 hypothetical protein [Methanothermococcus okinawensis]